MTSTIKEKISFLEETLNRFIINSDKILYNLSKEMKDFKEDIRVLKNEVRAEAF